MHHYCFCTAWANAHKRSKWRRKAPTNLMDGLRLGLSFPRLLRVASRSRAGIGMPEWKRYINHLNREGSAGPAACRCPPLAPDLKCSLPIAQGRAATIVRDCWVSSSPPFQEVDIGGQTPGIRPTGHLNDLCTFETRHRCRKLCCESVTAEWPAP